MKSSHANSVVCFKQEVGVVSTKHKLSDKNYMLQTILNNLELTLNVAARYIKKNISKKDDIQSVALLALIVAVRNAKTNLKDDSIEPYICTYVSKAILKFLISDSVIPIPASTLQRNKNLSIKVISIKDNLTYSNIRVADLRDLIYSLAQDPIDEQIIKLRLKGFKDHEIAPQIGKAVSFVFNRRKMLEERFDSKIKDESE